jgi:uncharacterized membrane protein
MIPVFTTLAQVAALLLISLVAGSMFGIWRGYDPALYAPATFVEAHQGAVRGLNTLLPAMAIAALVLVVVLAVLARSRPMTLVLYVAAALAIVIGGLITRLANQPINDLVMAWTPTSLPENWTELRDSWWGWHMARLAATVGAEVLLIAAVFADREA